MGVGIFSIARRNMKREILIDGKIVPMEASADTPRAYRVEFGEDIIVGLRKLKGTLDMEIVEKLAYIMAKACNEQIGGIDEWLKGFDNPMAIYQVSSEIIGIWIKNGKTTSNAEKK